MSITKDNLRRIVAAAFLIFLLAEWGSHAVAYAHTSSDEGSSVYSNEGGHEDPCKTLIRCSDGRRQDQQVPNLKHDATQHNAFFAQLSELNLSIGLEEDPDIPFSKVDPILRPKIPPFHPPELS